MYGLRTSIFTLPLQLSYLKSVWFLWDLILSLIYCHFKAIFSRDNLTLILRWYPSDDSTQYLSILARENTNYCQVCMRNFQPFVFWWIFPWPWYVSSHVCAEKYSVKVSKKLLWRSSELSLSHLWYCEAPSSVMPYILATLAYSNCNFSLLNWVYWALGSSFLEL